MSMRARMLIWIVLVLVLAAIPGRHWWVLAVGAATYLLLFWTTLGRWRR